MNRTQIYPKKKTITYPIPFNGRATLFVSTGDKVVFDQHLFDVQKNAIAESHYLPKLLSIKPENSEDYVGRIAGEYIEEGDLLAEKLTAGGLIERRIVSSEAGIISLDRISQGYIDILGESISESYNSVVRGIVKTISLGSHIEIEAESAALPYTADNNLHVAEEDETESVVGNLVLVKDGNSVYTIDDLKDNYAGYIVYAGRFAYPSLVKEIFMRGAYAVITYSMNYADMLELNVPIIVLNGFGQLTINREIENFILGSVNHLVKVDGGRKSIYVANQSGIELESFPGKKYFSGSLTVGDKVISVSPEFKGVIGEVAEIIEQDGPNKVIVTTKGKNRIVMYDEMLEHYYFKA